jgi:hypothetical protein
VGKNAVVVVELHTEHRVWQSLLDFTFKLDRLFFLAQNLLSIARRGEIAADHRTQGSASGHAS